MEISLPTVAHDKRNNQSTTMREPGIWSRTYKSHPQVCDKQFLLTYSLSMSENETAFDRFKIRPRILCDVSNIDTSTTFLGEKANYIFPSV